MLFTQVLSTAFIFLNGLFSLTGALWGFVFVECLLIVSLYPCVSTERHNPLCEHVCCCVNRRL